MHRWAAEELAPLRLPQVSRDFLIRDGLPVALGELWRALPGLDRHPSHTAVHVIGEHVASGDLFGLTVESGTVVIVSPGAGENVSVLANSTVVAFAECLRTYWAVANPDTASVVRWLPVETQHRIVRDLRTLIARKDEPAFAEEDFFWPAKLQFDDDDICEPEDPFKTGMLEP